ncbi:unnamed protein product [marine sediment metagenome]|uniref:Roadblock/LAMTOR2 domain-containing protein n=1 Tax=marine sediment metagenome TaxID=412755 RepID=X1RPH9_9ZZZZ
MLNKEVIEKKLAQLFDVVPETEGLIASDLEGKVIVGQTITDMDHNGIAKACATIIKNTNALGKQVVEALKEGGLKFIRLETNKGETMIALEEQLILIILK